MNLLAVVWDFDPTIFTIGNFEIRWYSLTWVAALLFGGWIFSYFCRREGKPEGVSDTAFLYIALGTIIGARLGHCLFYEPMEYLREPWRIITGIREGGLASHGAAIGIVLGIWLSSRKNKVSVLWTADRLGILAPLSGAMIRFGNLFNSEIFGHTTDLPWGFQFVRSQKWAEDFAPNACHPTQIYEALCYILCFVILFVLYRYTKVAKREGFIFGAAMVGIFLSRFLIEFVKDNQETFEDGMLLNMGQLLSLPFIVAGIAFMIWAWFSKRDSAAAELADVPKVHAQKNKRHFKK